ncbi:hypothetical protein F2P81_018390 [Scophthalmus maximus]|uniref:Uncharacterized protein n=1 Tax=Scophthalmus maximus TaxID=52904 RepID=A0A6A4SA89_SCOMX|nr:hypothetical protein F2P81_018390 [Scophthalmus maximus]
MAGNSCKNSVSVLVLINSTSFIESRMSFMLQFKANIMHEDPLGFKALGASLLRYQEIISYSAHDYFTFWPPSIRQCIILKYVQKKYCKLSWIYPEAKVLPPKPLNVIVQEERRGILKLSQYMSATSCCSGLLSHDKALITIHMWLMFVYDDMNLSGEPCGKRQCKYLSLSPAARKLSPPPPFESTVYTPVQCSENYSL